MASSPVGIVSLGAGVQSSALLLLAIEGRFGDVPAAAVFADTQGEPAHVYEWLDFLEELVAPFPIHRCTAGNLGEDYARGRRRAAIPAYSRTAEGKPMLMSRFCSKTYKVEAIYRKVRELVGKGGRAESWIGISIDEAQRMKPTGKKWIANRWPLIEANLSRVDCLRIVEERTGRRPPKSACLFCPFHGDAQWLDLKRNHPEDFAKAVEFDARIRDIGGDKWDRERFLHRSLRPLDQVKFMHEDQAELFDQFGNECEGICGV